MVKQDVTTILVSHQLERVAQLCTRAVLLRRGEVAHVGSASETIGAYVNGVNEEAQGARTDSPLLIRTAALVTDGPIVSGSRVQIRVECDVLDPVRVDDTSGVGVRVRSMQNGKVLFATSSMRQGVSLSGLARFALDVTLQLNTAPGVYAIETVVFDDLVRQRAQLIANGPWVTVTVQEGKSFHGEVQMNPEMTLRSPRSIGEPRETADLPPRREAEGLEAPLQAAIQAGRDRP
jgi:hypothetical protein